MRHQFGRTHTQGVQDAHHVRRLILLVVAAIRLRREAQPTQVGRDNHVVFDECARQMTPHVARCAEAVQHDDRWTMTADPHMDGCTVGFDRPRLHHSRINPIYVGTRANALRTACYDGRLSLLLMVGYLQMVLCNRSRIRVSARLECRGGPPVEDREPARGTCGHFGLWRRR